MKIAPSKFFLIFLFAFFFQLAMATERNDPVTNTLTGGSPTLNNTNDAVASVGDVLVGGDTSKAIGLGFAYGLGDVDLNEGRNCYVSTATGNIIFGKQKVELNAWCAALFYDANRKHEFAAKMRCSIDKVADQYSLNEDCVLDQTLGEITASPVHDAIINQLQEFEEEREVLVEEVRQELENLEQQISAPSPSRTIYRDEGADRRAAAKIALKGEKN